MVVSRNNSPHIQIHINYKNIEQVIQFKYIRRIISQHWDRNEWIRRRTEQAKTASLSSVFLYGVETGTLKVTFVNKIEAFKM